MNEERQAVDEAADDADLGGDPVCWLNRVCMECGRFAAEPGERCAECGAELPD